MPNIPVAIGDIGKGAAQRRFDQAVAEIRVAFADPERSGDLAKIRMEFVFERVTEDYFKVGVANVSSTLPSMRRESAVAFFDEDGELVHDENNVAPGGQTPIKFLKEV